MTNNQLHPSTLGPLGGRCVGTNQHSCIVPGMRAVGNWTNTITKPTGRTTPNCGCIEVDVWKVEADEFQGVLF